MELVPEAEARLRQTHFPADPEAGAIIARQDPVVSFPRRNIRRARDAGTYRDAFFLRLRVGVRNARVSAEEGLSIAPSAKSLARFARFKPAENFVTLCRSEPDVSIKLVNKTLNNPLICSA